MEKPWGRETWWAQTEHYVGKLIEVNAGQSLSLQYHQYKTESMYFLSGTGLVVYGEELLPIRPGLSLTIEPGTVHRIIAHENVKVMEVSTPQVTDVIRLEDRYGRQDA